MKILSLPLMCLLALAGSAAAAPTIFYSHAVSCAPASPSTSDRSVTCSDGLDATAPSGSSTVALELNTTSSARTVSFVFSTAPLAEGLALQAGNGTAVLFAGATGGGNDTRAPVDLAVELHKNSVGGPNLGSGARGAQTLRSNATDRFDVPFALGGNASDRTLAPGDRLVFIVLATNQTGSNFRIVLALDATAVPTSTGPLPLGCLPSDPDADHDGTPDLCDDCVHVPDAAQADANHDGTGDACQCIAASPGTCVPGGGSPRTDCLGELQPIGATLTLDTHHGIPTKNVRCADGDPACDADGLVDGTCHLRTILCLNNLDPRLPLCQSAAVNVAEIRGRARDAIDAANQSAFETAAHDLGLEVHRRGGATTPGAGTTQPNACSPTPFMLTVPQAGTQVRKLTVRFARTNARGHRVATDEDILQLACLPGEPTTTTTSSTTTSSTVSSTTSSSSTTSATTTSSTSTTVPPTGPFLDFTTGLAGGICGHSYTDTAFTTVLKNLTCGGLSIGGGASSVPEGPTPEGETSRYRVACTGNACTVSAFADSGPSWDCTDTGCIFGTPLPIPNAGLSTCVQNTYSAPVSGTLDLGTGVTSLNVVLTSNTVLTGNPTQPCPVCRAGSVSGALCAGTPGSPCVGVCEGSPNQGAACISTNGQGLSRDCPQPASTATQSICYKGSKNGQPCSLSSDCPGGGVCSIFVGALAVNLTPLTTGSSEKSDAAGLFCPGQPAGNPGCFPSGKTCRAIRETGTAAGLLTSGGPAKPVTLASTFCIPASSSILINGAAGLPGPGATSLPGTFKIVP